LLLSEFEEYGTTWASDDKWVKPKDSQHKTPERPLATRQYGALRPAAGHLVTQAARYVLFFRAKL
jgi:hypothetical protein